MSQVQEPDAFYFADRLRLCTERPDSFGGVVFDVRTNIRRNMHTYTKHGSIQKGQTMFS